MRIGGKVRKYSWFLNKLMLKKVPIMLVFANVIGTFFDIKLLHIWDGNLDW